MGGTGAGGELRGDSICAAVTCPSVTKTTTLCATCSTNKRAICSSQTPSLARKSWRKTGKRRSECRMLQLWGLSRLTRCVGSLPSAHGADTEILDQAQLRERYPWMVLDDVVAAALGAWPCTSPTRASTCRGWRPLTSRQWAHSQAASTKAASTLTACSWRSGAKHGQWACALSRARW